MLCLSAPILGETGTTLHEKVSRLGRRYHYDAVDIDRFLDLLAELGELSSNLPDIRAVPDDPDDDMIVATAVAAGADVVVTGDRHLLSLGAYGTIRMITPRMLLDMVAP